MARRSRGGLRCIGLFALLFVLLMSTAAWAQVQRLVQGVRVTPNGVLERIDIVPRRRAARLRQSAPKLTADVRKPSATRKVSLTRLARQLQEAAAGGAVPEEMRHLAGLYRVDYLFVYPDAGEIVIAGPAEGWTLLADGTAVGVRSGEIILELDDLITAVRAFGPDAGPDRSVGCSIDPSAEGIRRVNALLSQIRGSLDPRQLPRLATELQQAMGPHEVVVFGVPHESGIAFKMVAADYAMKMLALGVVRAPVRRLRSYVDRVPLTRAGQTLVQRWWFVPAEGMVSRTEDGLSWVFARRRVRLVGESDVQMRRFGDRSSGREADRWNRQFAQQFTDAFAELSRRCPVFAELENVFDLLAVAMILQYGGVAERAGWDRSELLSGGVYEPATWPTPHAAQTLTRVLRKGARATTPIGGVRVGPSSTVLRPSTPSKPAPPAELPTDPRRWWWD